MKPEKIIDFADGKMTVRYRTLADVQVAIANATPKSQSVKQEKRFTGTDSLEQYAQMLAHGWRDALTGVANLQGLVTTNAKQPLLRPHVAGCFANVPAFCASDPNSMYQLVHEHRERKRVTLVVNSSYAGNTDYRDVIKYARAVLPIVSQLEAELIDTEVYSLRAGREPHIAKTHYAYVIPVKAFGTVLQPERIASMLHPSWLRRAQFALTEHEHRVYNDPITRGMVTSGDYGLPLKQDKIDGRMLRGIFGDSASTIILLPAVSETKPAEALNATINAALNREYN